MSLFDEFKDLNDFKEQCGYTIDGDWYPRVTKIVTIKAKPALYYYYGEAKSYRRQRNRRSARRRKARCCTRRWKDCCSARPKRSRKRWRQPCESFQDFLKKNHYPCNAGTCGTPHREPRPSLRGHGGRDRADRRQARCAWTSRPHNRSIATIVCRPRRIWTRSKMNSRISRHAGYLKIDQMQKCLRCGAIRRVKGGREKIKTDWKEPSPA